MGVHVLVLLLSFMTLTMADTPANCTYEEVKGKWLFKMGSTSHDGTIDCSKMPDVETEIVVELLYPDIVKDEFGNTGFWTLVYNQGFEVVIGNRKYFAFSMYSGSGKNVTSYCDQTLPGWSHGVLERHWACFTGQKVVAVPPKSSIDMSSTHKKIFSNMYYKTDNDFINKINSMQSSWKAVAYPELEQLTLEQVLRRSGGRRSKVFGRPRAVAPKAEEILKARELPASFDWRQFKGQNFVSPVRNQESCGSCFAFASMAMNEARVRVMTNNTQQPVFSPQDIVECSEYSQGCEGGFPYLIAGKYAEDFGLVAESCNPYTGKDGKCSTDKTCKRQYSTNYRYVGGYYGACNEVEMRRVLVNNGPLAVSFEVYNDFLHYKSGIYHFSGLHKSFNPFEITNHVVVIVGYGTDAMLGLDYWIVKNSWGEKWGEDGFFRIRRGQDECAIESIAVESTPTVY